jgi:hypothetical protein
MRRWSATTSPSSGSIPPSTPSQPTIAAIQGNASAASRPGGTCDLRFAVGLAPGAAAPLGLGYGFAGRQRFINTIGPSHTKDVFSARQSVPTRPMDGDRQPRPAGGRVEAFVKDYAGTVAANAPLMVGAAAITNEVLASRASAISPAPPS